MLALDIAMVVVALATVIGFAMMRQNPSLRSLALPQVMLDPLLAGLIVLRQALKRGAQLSLSSW